MKMLRIISLMVTFFLGLSYSLSAQNAFKDWQGFSENNTPAVLTEQTYKDKSCIKLDGKNEAIIIKKDKKYENFRIDLDIASRVMGGIGFHVKNEQNYQFLYFRPGYGGTQEAIQYVPIYNGGLSWVMYHYPIYEAKAAISQLEWFHATIEVRGSIMKVFVNYKKEPDLIVSLLDTDTDNGSILLRSMFGESYFANVYIQELPKILYEWSVSEQLVRDKTYEYTDMKKIKNWTKINERRDEVVNLKRYYEYPNGTVFARCNIVSEADKPKLMYFDFTGKLKVFLNGKEVYNYARFKLERLELYQNCTALELKKGDNELVFIIEGDASFLGEGFNAMGRKQHQNWGFVAGLADMAR
ncbi:family 16 glycoside hydrolase [Emticicia sp. TH156]|uniref:family 16 glycoside hydrolase n=1 Tax=Emticicia sp. TH156 TaxID=2067454 RepID=UPI000C76B54E|nr:family 16 glycoside hydrolase [Emticicia sp. TH156]PLK45846.1 hypothetical protein C0V77_00360 [Emticicia sp. TH156]